MRLVRWSADVINRTKHFIRFTKATGLICDLQGNTCQISVCDERCALSRHPPTALVRCTPLFPFDFTPALRKRRTITLTPCGTCSIKAWATAKKGLNLLQLRWDKWDGNELNRYEYGKHKHLLVICCWSGMCFFLLWGWIRNLKWPSGTHLSSWLEEKPIYCVVNFFCIAELFEHHSRPHHVSMSLCCNPILLLKLHSQPGHVSSQQSERYQVSLLFLLRARMRQMETENKDASRGKWYKRSLHIRPGESVFSRDARVH